MKTAVTTQGGFTGRHMLIIMVCFFSVVISVNLLMAHFAMSSWSGLVAQDTYVASQQFNGKAEAARAMMATGNKSKLIVDRQSIRYTLVHPETGIVDLDKVVAHFKRPVGEHQDFMVELARDSTGAFASVQPVLSGQWIVEVTASKDDRTIMHEAIRIMVMGDDQ